MATAKRTRKPKTTKSTSDPLTSLSSRTVDIQEAIRCRAYEIYERRGCQDGRALDDWLSAEAEVRSRFGAA